MAEKPYYQNDKKWENQKIGTSDSFTIGQVGCLLTSLAMVVNHYGGKETPVSLNQKMIAAKGFNGAWIKSAMVPGLFPDLGFQRQKSTECTNKSAPMGDIDTSLAAGSLVIVQVDREEDATFEEEDGHWVLLRKKEGDDYTMWDPWYNKTASDKLVERYGFGRKKAEDIIQYVIWHGEGAFPTATPTKASTKTDTAVSPKATKPTKPRKSSKPAPATKNETIAVKPTVAQLTLRKQPKVTQSNIIKTLSATDVLILLKSNEASKIGQKEQWLNVRDASDAEGYVAAWYVQKTAVPRKTTPSSLTVKTSADSVSLRNAPRVADDTLITYLPKSTKLTIIEANGASKLGKNGQWLQVQTTDGQKGYIAAWLVAKA